MTHIAKTVACLRSAGGSSREELKQELSEVSRTPFCRRVDQQFRYQPARSGHHPAGPHELAEVLRAGLGQAPVVEIVLGQDLPTWHSVDGHRPPSYIATDVIENLIIV